jgi:hypothetical protein
VKSAIKEKFLYVSSLANDVCPYSIESKLCQHPKQKSGFSSAFSFDEEGAKEKAIKKKTPK